MNEEQQSSANSVRAFVIITLLIIILGGAAYFFVNSFTQDSREAWNGEKKEQQQAKSEKNKDKSISLESLVPIKSEKKNEESEDDEVPVIPQPILHQKNDSVSIGEEELKESQSDQVESVSKAKTYPLTINTIAIEAELVETKEQQERGLGGRESMPDNYGLLYILPKPYFYDFWMKDMKFSIDIIWVDRNQNIVDITRNLSPDSYPRIFQPVRPAQFVIEVNAGFADKHGIKIGDPVTIPKIQ